MDTFKPGDNWVICDRTGYKIRASDARREWNGALVRKESWEPRQPQDLVRGRADNSRPDLVRSRQTDYFLSDGEVTRESL